MSSIEFMPLIIIIHQIRPALVVSKFVKTVQNLTRTDQLILPITPVLNKIGNNIP